MRPALIALFLAACAVQAPAEEGHLTIFLDTDAPLARTGLARASFEPIPLVDTARVELFDAAGNSACAGCVREFALDETLVERGASFTTIGSGARLVHAMLFHALSARTAPPGAKIEIWARLPAPPPSGNRDLVLTFPMNAFGRPVGTKESPIDLADGPRPSTRAHWPLAERRGCTHAPPEGTTCIEGGAFWAGSPDDASSTEFLAPRIVALSPFFVDLTEVSVRAYRDGGGNPAGVNESTRSTSGTHAQDFCTFTRTPGPYDDFPVNCIGYDAARAFCKQRGGDLVTEMQHEFVASSFLGLPYPWGRELPTCSDAVLARGPASERFEKFAGAFDSTCRPATDGDPTLNAIGFPAPIHRTSLGRDAVTTASGAVVQDLVGNLAEWSLDDWQDRTGSCWYSPEVAVDPRCTASGGHVLRGGSWAGSLVVSSAWTRTAYDDGNWINLGAGFRCAFPD